MAIELNGTTGITTPGLINTGSETIVNLTTTGNTILGDASTDTLNVGNGGLVKDASGNVGIGTASPTAKLTVNGNQSFAEKTAAYIGVDIATTAGNGGNFTIKAGNGSGSGNTSGNLYVGAGRGSVSATSGFIAFGLAQATNAVGLDTEYMRLDASGNLGLGVTPSAWSGYKVIQAGLGSFAGGASGAYLISDNAYTDNSGAGWKYINSSYAPAQYYAAAGAHVWRTAPSGTAGNAITFTTAMTLDASGTLWTGGGSPTVPTGLTGFANGIFVAGSAANTSLFYTSAGVGAGVPIQVTRLNDGGGIYFFRNGSTAGNISIATGSISVNNASDYRLKDNVESLSGSLKKIMQVRPVTFTWKENGSVGKSVIAHELQEVFPEVVFGEKDATNEDGSIKTQSVALGNLMPDLISAIQEQQAMIDELKAKVAALEAA